jgi:hypothetical protein
MGMLTVSHHHLVGAGPIPLAYSKLKRFTMRRSIVGRGFQGQDDDGNRRQTALDLSESREARVEIKLFKKLIRAALSS